jgi:hypothetical protein
LPGISDQQPEEHGMSTTTTDRSAATATTRPVTLLVLGSMASGLVIAGLLCLVVFPVPSKP